MFLAVSVHIPEPGGLGGGVKADGGIVFLGQSDGLLVGDGPGHGVLLIGHLPVVAVIGHAHPNLFLRDFAQSVVYYPGDLIEGGHRHGRAVGIAPLVGHKEHIVRRRTQQAVVVALIEVAFLVCTGLGPQGYHNRDPQGSKTLPQIGDKLRVAIGVLGEDKLKVYIHPLVAFAPHRLHQSRNQPVLGLEVGKDRVGELV